jgi:uncharacterized protein (UPF0303 family)
MFLGQPELIADIDELEAQLAQLRFDELTHEQALSIGMDIAARAEERELPIQVSVYLGEHHVFRYACVGTNEVNDQWVARKKATVYKFHEPTFLVGQRYAARGEDFYEVTGLPEEIYAVHGGGFPLFVKDEFVGAVFVSGIPHEEDHAMLVEALTAARDD